MECLKLIGQLSHVTGDTTIPLAILEEYCNDGDPRVRTAAFQALVSFCVCFLLLFLFESQHAFKILLPSVS